MQSLQNLTRLKSIKLLANDMETIHLLSAIIQDGITCKTWLLLEKQTFKVLINRVCWENPREEIDGEVYIARLHSVLSIHNVIKVSTRNVKKDKLNFFSILSISCIQDEVKNLKKIIFTLSQGVIYITVKDFSVTMKDVSTYWLTSQEPQHDFISKKTKNKFSLKKEI